jgi:hypothetical protein
MKKRKEISMQTVQERIAMAREAAYQSALISGSDTGKAESEDFKNHVALMGYVLGSETKRITHPLVFNMALCGSKEHAQYRTSSRATVRTLVPEARFVKPLLKVWWWGIHERVERLKGAAAEVRERFAWEQHDFLVSLEPFADANARTARIEYYMFLVALDVPVKIIRSEKAIAYSERQRVYRRDVFAPRMRAAGYISA